MLSKAKRFLLCAAFLLVSLHILKASEQATNTISFDRYKKEHQFNNDQDCLENLFQLRQPNSKLILLFKSRTYYFTSTIILDSLNSRIVLEGRPGTRFNLSSTLLKGTAKNFQYSLWREVKRGSKYFDLIAHASQLSFLKFNSNDTVETAWGYRANDLMGIHEVTTDRIVFNDTLNFGYLPSQTELIGYLPSSMSFQNIHFQVDQSISHILSLTGMEVVFQDCKINYEGSPEMANGINLLDCYNIRVRNMVIRGNIDYGFLINGSRNIYFNNIRSFQCIHPLAPATFSTHIVVDKMFCNKSVIDAHPSFNVTYKHVTIVNGNGYWNCRALGVVLEDCNFKVRKDEDYNSLYLGVQGLTPKYEYLYDKYDIICRNVKWVHSDHEFNGLHVYRCREFLVENCKSHAIVTGGPVQRFDVLHCKAGRVYGRDSNFTVAKTKFNSKLQNNLPIKPPLSGSYNGRMNLRNCTFTGYKDTYLFNYIQATDTNIHFNNCSLSKFSGFASKTYAKDSEYTNVQFENCTLNRKTKFSFAVFDKIEYLK